MVSNGLSMYNRFAQIFKIVTLIWPTCTMVIIIVSVTACSQVAHLGSRLSPSPSHVAPPPSSLTCPSQVGILTDDSGSGNRQTQMCIEERGKILPVCKVLWKHFFENCQSIIEDRGRLFPVRNLFSKSSLKTGYAVSSPPLDPDLTPLSLSFSHPVTN